MSGWSFDAKDGWHISIADQARLRAQWAEISADLDVRQSRLPTCALCGQRCRRLDKFGLCSKTTDAHEAERKRLDQRVPTMGVHS